MNKIIKFAEPVVRKVDEKTKTIWHRISKEERDRIGDIVRISGIDLKQFKKKPAVLYGHLYGSVDPLPVVAENVGLDKIKGQDGILELWAGTRFLDPREFQDEKLRALIADLWTLNAKKLLGWSIGFVIKDNGYEELKDEEGKQIGWDFKETELLEYSNVVIPANAAAINDAFKKGLVSPASFETIHTRIPMISEQRWIPPAPKVILDKNNNIDFGNTFDPAGPISPGAKILDTPESVITVKIDGGRVEPGQDLEPPKKDEGPTSVGKFNAYLREIGAEPIEREFVEKPYENEHACRLQDPDKYDRFTRGSRKHEGKTYHIIFGWRKNDEGEEISEEQAYRYKKDEWTAAEARAHCKAHDGDFEAAAGEKCEPCAAKIEDIENDKDLQADEAEEIKIIGPAISALIELEEQKQELMTKLIHRFKEENKWTKN